MKKGFKKFLGAMAALSIFGGNIGANAFYSSTLAGNAGIGINDLRSSIVDSKASIVKLLNYWAK